MVIYLKSNLKVYLFSVLLRIIMYNKSRKCCVPGCRFEGTERFRLPNPRKEEAMLRTWISIIGGDLLQMSLEDIYNKKRICKCHFTDNYFNPGCKGLLRTAVPTLYVPSKYYYI